MQFNIYSLLQALYAVSCVLITFGALIGKISPLQMIVLTIVELVCHGANYKVLMDGVMKNLDIGGTYIDHMFGCYFGLAASFMLGPPRKEEKLGYTADLFSLVGTLFLWIYWPSFVGGAATPNSPEQQRAICNTILSLSGSTVGAYIFSSLLADDKRFRPVDIQNATLAGGVAIGSIADLKIGPFAAVITGVVAGIVSAYGFKNLTPYFNSIGIHDTCGINNLHGIPSIIGALSSVIVQGYKGTQAGVDPSQWWFQLVAMFLCLGYSVVTGLATGWLLSTMRSIEIEEVTIFHDIYY